MSLNDEKQPDERKTYSPPTLSIYGDVTRLTASGTGTQSESPGNTPITKKP